MDVFGLIGKCVADKYQVEGVIGQGGYGVVYAAKHLMLGKQVALKKKLKHVDCVGSVPG